MKRMPSETDRQKQIDHDFSWIDRLSWLMDNQFKLGRFRFGLDPLLNLVPFGGAIIGFGTSLILVVAMWRNGASPKLVILMLLNVTWDAIVGSIPLIGNIFDFFSKANERNIRLLREHYYQGKHRGSGIGIIVSLLLLIVALLVGIVYLIVLLAEWTYEGVATFLS